MRGPCGQNDRPNSILGYRQTYRHAHHNTVLPCLLKAGGGEQLQKAALSSVLTDAVDRQPMLACETVSMTADDGRRTPSTGSKI